MLWDQVVGHSAVKNWLREAVEKNRVYHAYLFAGPTAVGKSLVARVFAASVLCAEGGCGECNVCRRVMEGKHPDVTMISPAGKNIPVDTIRQMRLSAFRKPVESDRKVYIIKNAERMWEEGASTLLKVLEEPPGDVVFILVTANRSRVLPTIRSRCHEVSFSLVPFGELRDHLTETKGVSDEEADLIARLNDGVPGRALKWCDEPWRLERRHDVIQVARALKRADLNRSLEMAQELYAEIKLPVDELATFNRERKKELKDGSLDDGLIGRLAKEMDADCRREQIKEEIRGVKEVLSILAWWYRDILMFKEGGGEDILVNVDLVAEITEEAEALPARKVLDCIELVNEGMRAAEQNVATQLNLESTLLGIQEALYA